MNEDIDAFELATSVSCAAKLAADGYVKVTEGAYGLRIWTRGKADITASYTHAHMPDKVIDFFGTVRSTIQEIRNTEAGGDMMMRPVKGTNYVVRYPAFDGSNFDVLLEHNGEATKLPEVTAEAVGTLGPNPRVSKLEDWLRGRCFHGGIAPETPTPDFDIEAIQNSLDDDSDRHDRWRRAGDTLKALSEENVE